MNQHDHDAEPLASGVGLGLDNLAEHQRAQVVENLEDLNADVGTSALRSWRTRAWSISELNDATSSWPENRILVSPATNHPRGINQLLFLSWVR